MSRVAPAVYLTKMQRSDLERVVRATGSTGSQVTGARIILLAAAGSLNEEIAVSPEIPKQTAGK